jgi:hypothetical protein
MQAVLFYHEADDAAVAKVRVDMTTKESGRQSQPGVRTLARQGKIDVTELAATVLWWTDTKHAALHIFAMSTRHDLQVPAMSASRHLALSFPADCAAADVTYTASHAHHDLVTSWCTHAGEIVVSYIRLRRADDGSLGIEYMRTTQTTLNLQGAAPTAICASPGIDTASAAVSFLAAAGRSVFSISVDDEGAAAELLLWDARTLALGARDTITCAAYDAARRTVLLGISSGQLIAVRVHADSNPHVTFTLGPHVVAHALYGCLSSLGTEGPSVFYAVAHDTMLKTECVVKIVESQSETFGFGVTDRITAFSNSKVIALGGGAHEHEVAVAWDEAPRVASVSSLVLNLSSSATSTLVHSARLARGPLHVPLADAKAAFVVAADAQADDVMLLVTGGNGRVRVYATVRNAALHRVPDCVLHGEATRPTVAANGQIAPPFAVVTESISSNAPTHEDTLAAVGEGSLPAWHSAVVRGAMVVEAAANGADMVRQLQAIAVARANMLPNSEIFERLGAEAAVWMEPIEDLTEAGIIDAGRQLLDAANDTLVLATAGHPVSWARADTVGLFPMHSHRFATGTLLLELHRRLAALILVEVARRHAGLDGARHFMHAALRRVAGAIAVVRSVAPKLHVLAPDADSAAGAIAEILRALLAVRHEQAENEDEAVLLTAVAGAVALQSVPIVALAIRATSAWTGTWLDALPVLRHFSLCGLLAKNATQAAAPVVMDHLKMVVDALGAMRPATACAVVAMIAPELLDVPNDTFLPEILSRADESDAMTIARGFYVTAVLRALHRDSQSCLWAEDVERLRPYFEAFSSFALHEDCAVRDQLRTHLTNLQLELELISCRNAMQTQDTAAAFASLQRLTGLKTPASELVLVECVRALVAHLLPAGRLQELVRVLVSDGAVSAAVAKVLYEQMLDPKGIATTREQREQRRIDVAVALFTFLLSRGALSSAARVAYDVASAMRSSPQRVKGTLERALALLSMSVNSAEILPDATPGVDDGVDEEDSFSNMRNWSERSPAADLRQNTTFGATPGDSGIASITKTDVPELKRRWQQLRCEVLLENHAAPICAPWAPIDLALHPADVAAATDTVKELIRARLWEDALVLAEAWHVDAALVFRSQAVDLLEAPGSERQWKTFIQALTRRSSSANNHKPLADTLYQCLQHPKYKNTPTELKQVLGKLDSEAALACYLNLKQLSASCACEALEMGIAYCTSRVDSQSIVREAVSAAPVSFALLDRLAAFAQKVKEKRDSDVRLRELVDGYLASFRRLISATTTR